MIITLTLINKKEGGFAVETPQGSGNGKINRKANLNLY
jgi:hypothetical protein